MSKTKTIVQSDGPTTEDSLSPNTGTTRIPTVELPDGSSRLRVQFDITYKGTPGKEMDGQSQTEPDMTLTVAQLLERHSRGQEIPGQKEPVYFEIPVPTFNDLTDVERFHEQIKETEKKTKEFIDNEKAAAKEAAKAAKAQEKNQKDSAKLSNDKDGEAKDD